MMRNGVYGNPGEWEDVPSAITAAIVSALYAYGWRDTSAVASRVTVPLDSRAVGLPEARARGEHLRVEWGASRPEWTWTTVHPEVLVGGHRSLLLAPSDDANTIAAQILRVLRTGRALP